MKSLRSFFNWKVSSRGSLGQKERPLERFFSLEESCICDKFTTVCWVSSFSDGDGKSISRRVLLYLLVHVFCACVWVCICNTWDLGTRMAPAYANIFMGRLESQLLQQTSIVLAVWWRYMDDIFTIWPYGEEKFKIFVQQINSMHSTIKFTAKWSYSFAWWIVPTACWVDMVQNPKKESFWNSRR